ncbi:hypothetical protein HS7_06700 [Sulfolobales archaeon HS-7]|nr:hypothetical protein HS7_06700 [Sulfolobales archaeon HS-7]
MIISVNKGQEIIQAIKKAVYDYNSKIRGSGYYLKPIHMVYKKGKVYIYIGRYWYRITKKNRVLKWTYLGKSKPIIELPEPPSIPEGVIIKEGDNYLLDESILNSELLSSFLHNASRKK